MKAWIVFDGPPGNESGRFVEVENEAGASISAAQWTNMGNGMWKLGPFETIEDHFDAMAERRMSQSEFQEDR